MGHKNKDYISEVKSDGTGAYWRSIAKDGDIRVEKKLPGQDWKEVPNGNFGSDDHNSSKTRANKYIDNQIIAIKASEKANPTAPTAQVEKAQETTAEAHKAIGEKLAEIKDYSKLSQILSDAFHAQANEHNLKNPDNPVDGLELIQEARDDYTKIPEKAQKILEGYFGEGEEKKLPNNFYNDLIWNFESQKNKYGLMDALDRAKEERRDVLGGLKDRFNDPNRDDATLGNMLREGTPYQRLWDRVPEEYAQNPPDPQELQRMKAMTDLQLSQADSFRQGEILSQSMPQQPLNLNWNDQPTYQKAKSLWEEMQPNYSYESARPYDQRLHNLARAGHGAGSSSIDNTEAKKQRAMHWEDLQNMQQIHNMLLGEHRAKGDTVGYLDKLASASRGAYQDPIALENKILGQSFDRENRQRYNEDVFAKDIAQGEMNLSNQDLQQDAMLHDILEKDRINKISQSQQAQNLVNQFDMLIQTNNIEGAKDSAEYAVLREDLWTNREKIMMALKQQGMQEQELERMRQSDKKQWIQDLMQLGGKATTIVGSVLAAKYTGGASLALSRSIGSLVEELGRQRSGMGTSSTSTTPTPEGNWKGFESWRG